jgi:hypothetical protein
VVAFVEVMPPHTNTALAIPGSLLLVGQRESSRPTCRDEVLAAMHGLANRTGREVFTVARVFDEMDRAGTSYKRSTVYKTMQRMKSAGEGNGHRSLERKGPLGFRLKPEA